jgi:hypothetical protein
VLKRTIEQKLIAARKREERARRNQKAMPAEGTLRFTMVEGRDMPKMDLLGLCDPFCVIKCVIVSPRLASPRLASPRLASPRLASPRLASPRLASTR